MEVEGTNTPLNLAYRERHQLTEKQQQRLEKYNTVVREEFTVKRVHDGKRNVKKVKEALIPAVINEIDRRYESFETPEIKAMQLVDHTLWDHTDPTQFIAEINLLSETFTVPLSQHGFVLDKAKCEFRDMKRLAHRNYSNFK